MSGSSRNFDARPGARLRSRALAGAETAKAGIAPRPGSVKLDNEPGGSMRTLSLNHDASVLFAILSLAALPPAPAARAQAGPQQPSLAQTSPAQTSPSQTSPSQTSPDS